MSEADRIDMDVTVQDLASVREQLSLCSRAFSTATQKIEEYSKSPNGEYKMPDSATKKSIEILGASAKSINNLALHLSRLEEYVLEYLGCRYEG